MFDQYISTLLSSIFSLYLPIAESGTRIAVSLALSNIFVFLGKYIIDHFHSFGFINKYFQRGTSIRIDFAVYHYGHIQHYLYKNHINKFKHGYKGFNTVDIIKSIELFDNYIIDDFNCEGIIYKIYIKSYINLKRKEDNKDVDDHIIISYDYNDITILEKYIKFIVDREMKIFRENNNEYLLHKVNIEIKNKNERELTWKSKFVSCNKNTNNTIVSENVKTNLIDDIDIFINNKEKYKKLGRPYKRGYILYGEPGCGKTSLIKILANKYTISIILVDLNVFKNNEEFISIIDKIKQLTSQNYILLFEDVDRCKIFNKSDEGVTEDCLLNILDGVDEAENRITIMTTNNLDILKRCPALIRHGRIDKCINVTYCSLEQIIGLLKLYFPDEKIDNLEEGTKITPAMMIHLIEYINDLPKIINFLNKKLDLSTIDIETYDFSS